MLPTNLNRIPVFLLTASFIALASAYIAEYGFDLKPCVLCLYQRIPYAVIIVLSLLVLILGKGNSCVKSFLKICFLVFLAGTGLALFHVGVEQGLWQGTEGCGLGGSDVAKSVGQSIDELRSAILGAEIVRCDTPAFVFLGVSMAGWNAVFSMFLMFWCLVKFKSLNNESKN